MHLTRRHFLQSSGALALYLGVAPSTALGALAGPIRPVKRKKTLVVIFLRGGIDGLNLLVPHADAEYRRLRPTVGIPAPGAEGGCLDLDGFYGLHPAMRNLLPAFQNGTACAVQAVGYAKNTRSHFEEQDTWETGVIGNTVHSDGWLNRHLATSASDHDAPIRALAIGNTLPRMMRGKASTFAVRGLDDLTLPGKGATRDKMAAALEKAYGKSGGDMGSGMAGDRTAAGDLLEQTGKATLEGLNTLKQMTSQPYTPAAKYPENGFAKKLMETARLIKADIGLEIAEVDLGGWDTHRNQGSGSTGAYAQRLGALSNAIAAFLQDLGPKMDDVLLLTLSEFGRTAAENGTAGTDHGWGNALLAFGGPVKKASAARGGKTPVVGEFPGLKKDELNRGRDLQHRIDFRDVISEAVGVHLGNTNLGKVIPGYDPTPVGFLA